eukprot:m.134802 g.134802  ORF g.134802 m.134802 type:complete len:634 (-) comp15981_c0_seq1:140-2041(-)
MTRLYTLAVPFAFLALSLAQDPAKTQDCVTHADCEATEFCGCTMPVDFASGDIVNRCQPRAVHGQSCGGFTPCPNRCQDGLRCQTRPSQPFEPRVMDMPGVCCPSLTCECPAGQQQIVDEQGCLTCDCKALPCGGLDRVAMQVDQEFAMHQAPLPCQDDAGCHGGTCDISYHVCCQPTMMAAESVDVQRQRRSPSTTRTAPDEDPSTSTAPQDDELESTGSTSTEPVQDTTTTPSPIMVTDNEDDLDDYLDELENDVVSTTMPDADMEGEADVTTITEEADRSSTTTTTAPSDEGTTRPGMTGGWKPVDVADPRAVAAAQCALEQHNSEQDSELGLDLLELVTAEVQVVAGLKYRLTAHVSSRSNDVAGPMVTTMEVYVPPGSPSCSLNQLSPPVALEHDEEDHDEQDHDEQDHHHHGHHHHEHHEDEEDDHDGDHDHEDDHDTTTTTTEANNNYIRQLVALLTARLSQHLPSDDTWAFETLNIREPKLVSRSGQVVAAQAMVQLAYTHSCKGSSCSDAIPTGWYEVELEALDTHPEGDDEHLDFELTEGVSVDQAVAEASLPDESHQGDNLRSTRSGIVTWPSFWIAVGLVVLVVLGVVLTVRRRRSQGTESFTPMEFSNPGFGLSPTTPTP